MFRTTVAALLLLLLAAPAARAQASESKASDAPVQSAEEPSMDFELLETPPVAAEAPRLVDPALDAALARRRTMLTVHQGLGLATATSLAATVIVGQLHFDDRYRGFGDTGRFRDLHRGLVIGSSSLFASTGLLGMLSLLSPTPFKRELRWDTITFHKLFMSLATVGMLSQMALGLVAARSEGQLSQVALARAHQAVGYATMGCVTAGALMLVF
jgi:hypothetical protein